MAWDDWVFGILTGGLYNAGKAVVGAANSAGDTLDSAGNALDDAGQAIAVLGETFGELGSDLSEFTKELTELLSIKRSAPRNEADLWDEEVERLNALRTLETQLKKELAELNAEDQDMGIFESIFKGIKSSLEEAAIRAKLAIVRQQIREILNEEPGVIPRSLHNIQKILEHFNTLSQPKIDELADSITDNTEVTKDILEEVKQLFVLKTWKPVAEVDLKPEAKAELSVLDTRLKNFKEIVAKTEKVRDQLVADFVKVQPDKYINPKSQTAKILTPEELAARITKDAPGKIDFGNLDPLRTISNITAIKEPFSYSINTPADATAAAQPATISSELLSILSRAPIKMLKSGRMNHVSSALQSETVTDYFSSQVQTANRARFLKREMLKVEKAIFKIKFIQVTEKGVIPKMLDDIRGTTRLLTTQTVPKVNTILDSVDKLLISVDDTTKEAKQTVKNINKMLTNRLLRLGLMIFGGLSIVILVLAIILMIKAIFGI